MDMIRKMTIYFLALALIGFSCSGETNLSNSDIETDSTVTEVSDALVNEPNNETNDLFVYGIDISSHQGNEAETLDKKKDSITFVICRATDGITFTDIDFKSNWKMIQEKGFVRGAYHFFEGEDDPESQVDNYMNNVGEISTSDLPPIVDFEGSGIPANMNVESIQANLLQVLQGLEDKTKRTPILYTNINEGEKYLNSEAFAKYTLWIADYSGSATPTLPGVWKGTKWMFWQKTDSYMENGVKNDFDVFNGDQNAFSAFLESN